MGVKKLVVAAAMLGLATGPALAQAPDNELPYRALVADCFVEQDYVCALEELLGFGKRTGMQPVVVNLRQGATLLGAQMFAVLDRAQGNVPDQIYYEMTQAVINYILDAQPESPIATGPFMLLAAEACLAIEDWTCVRTATQPLQILMATEQFYITGESEDPDKLDINARVINLIQAYNRRER